jgi:ATP-dependent Clp protease ATP-binding subunit ClpB
MTSNLGARYLLVPFVGEVEREQVMARVREFFRPEFLNRLDGVVLFHQLTPDQLAQILDLMLAKEVQLAEKRGLELEVTPAARVWLLAQHDQPEFGARPLRRIISRHLREPLADFLLSQATGQPGGEVVVDIDGDQLRFTITDEAE